MDIKDIKIEAQTIVANEGRFEPHPEGYTPRVFAAVWERGAKVYEILQNGHAIPWPCLPILEGFDYWVLYVEHLADIDMHRAPKPKPKTKPRYPHSVELSGCVACLDPVPQADGYSERDDLPSDPGIAAQAESRSKRRCTCPEAAIVPCVIHKSGTPQWIGEIDGKRYSGLKPESGPLSHLPEGSH